MNGPHTALATGANRGIGLAIVEALAEAGLRVWLGARDLAAGQREAARLRARGLDVQALALDVASPASIDAALARLAREPGTVDTLVNNAGVLYQRLLLEMPDEQVAESIAVHLTGPLALVKGLLPAMRSSRYGRIVNISSGWGSFARGLGGPGAYGITKAALNALTVRLAAELPRSIKVNAMDPGWVRTRMGASGAPIEPREAAVTAVWLATLPDDGPTGGFFRDRMPIDW